MKNKSRQVKKICKKRKLRKDYERRRNINSQPPSKTEEFKKDILIPTHDEKGELKKDAAGNYIMREKTVIKSKRVKIIRKNKHGDELPVIHYPKSRKNKLSKAEIKKSNEADKNAIKTVT